LAVRATTAHVAPIFIPLLRRRTRARGLLHHLRLLHMGLLHHLRLMVSRLLGRCGCTLNLLHRGWRMNLRRRHGLLDGRPGRGSRRSATATIHVADVTARVRATRLNLPFLARL
jgi:hypothetical protein